MNYSAQQLFELLNTQDECPRIEAKGGQEGSHSVMETVCAFCNEPDLGGGYILMGVAEDDRTDFPQYKVVGISEIDKLQKDLATQCAGMFNIPVRPAMSVEKADGKTVLKIRINEMPGSQKPVFFKSVGLPAGAMRRIGSTDQHCTEDDMRVFYQDHLSYDQTPVEGNKIELVDESALNRYRTLREKVNPAAEELAYTDEELLEALGCVNRKNKKELNLAGLLLFGTKKAQRLNYPMLRVDYIRGPGNIWMQDPDKRFTTIDMQGPLILMIYRIIDAINADLPKGFLLADEGIQAQSTGLPVKSLREAIVNALMHRSYKEHRPTQVIRYDNRIEIINPGFSLKAEDKLGEPGSETRNPFIAAVFHETNLAETKGSGIRSMRKLMEQAHLAPPTFESDRMNNQFTVRLLLHHFLNEADVKWLSNFSKLMLSDTQKQALVFVREVGAIDNHTYRQLANCDTLKASADLRNLKEQKLLKAKGKGKATYYIPDDVLTNTFTMVDNILTTEADTLTTEAIALTTEADKITTEANKIHNAGEPVREELILELPQNVANKIKLLKRRESNKDKLRDIIEELCKYRAYTLRELSILLKKGDNYLSREFVKPMIESGKLNYKYPEMKNHPHQAYQKNK
jgi:ATP-dependent DNA helicase RecG